MGDCVEIIEIHVHVGLFAVDDHLLADSEALASSDWGLMIIGIEWKRITHHKVFLFHIELL